MRSLSAVRASRRLTIRSPASPSPVVSSSWEGAVLAVPLVLPTAAVALLSPAAVGASAGSDAAAGAEAAAGAAASTCMASPPAAAASAVAGCDAGSSTAVRGAHREAVARAVAAVAASWAWGCFSAAVRRAAAVPVTAEGLRAGLPLRHCAST